MLREQHSQLVQLKKSLQMEARPFVYAFDSRDPELGAGAPLLNPAYLFIMHFNMCRNTYAFVNKSVVYSSVSQGEPA